MKCFQIIISYLYYGELEKYDENVQVHYKEYLKTNDVWNRIKVKIKEENSN